MKCHSVPNDSQGFSIIELLIVIVIVSILAVIAVPSYQEYVKRTQRTVAKAALQELMSQQESYAVDHKGYAADFERLGIGSTSSAAIDIAYVNGDGTISRSNTNALYSLALHQSPAGTPMSASCASLSSAGPTIPAAAFSVSATPLRSGGDSRCGVLCASSRGERGAAGTGGVADCWRS